MYNSRSIGSTYENVAADYLAGKGYVILARNYRIASGEIDIVAEKDGYIVFVEVKYRSNFRKGAPEEAVGANKQRQISRVALHFLKHMGYGVDVGVRFDVITVMEDNIHHIENAFEYSWYN